jgi:hypothetical protein
MEALSTGYMQNSPLKQTYKYSWEHRVTSVIFMTLDYAQREKPTKLPPQKISERYGHLIHPTTQTAQETFNERVISLEGLRKIVYTGAPIEHWYGPHCHYLGPPERPFPIVDEDEEPDYDEEDMSHFM